MLLALFLALVAPAPQVAFVHLAPAAYAATLSLPPAAPVVDEYHLLSSQEEENLDQVVRRIKQASGVEITVFIPSSLQDEAIEDFAIDVARQWGLGRKKEDRGLLMVIAPKERQMRLEVGGGLEGDVTDVFARHVLDDGMRPLFKQGRYYDGILNALLTLQQKVPLGLDPGAAPAPVERQQADRIPFSWILLIFVVFWIFSRLSGFGRRRYYGGGWGGGGFFGGGGSSGGSWGGGGGGFSGGGSSSSW